MTDDKTGDKTGAAGIRDRITALVSEEHELRSHKNPTAEDHQRLKGIEEDLDVCWDLLRQRRARAETGLDPTEAEARPAREVEGYLQ
jgi:Protein of unknown function (DUF2630)